MFGVEDRTISLPSGIRWEAGMRRSSPFPYDHTQIPYSPEQLQMLGEILARQLRQPG